MMDLLSHPIEEVMRQLKINLIDLEAAFQSGDNLFSCYLDTETGKIIQVSDEQRSLLDRIYESYFDEQAETVDWETAFQEMGLPEWQRNALKEADQVEEGFGSSFTTIPAESSRDGYGDMQAFITTISSLYLQERLERAISGRDAFRYFKDVLLDYPAERERWFQFKQERLKQRMLDWLAMQGITPA